MPFETLKGSPHHFFAQLAGTWAGRNSIWLEPASSPMEAELQGSVQLVLDGRFALFLYQTTVDSETHVGMFTFGFNTTLDRYETTWVDSFHNNTAIMFCTGAAMEDGFAVIGGYPDPTGGPDWSWRTEVHLLDPDQLVITAFNILPDGLEYRAVEARLSRVKK